MNVSEYANVCSSHQRRYSSTSKEYKNLMDLKKTKKKQNAFGVQHTNWYKRVSSVTQSSRYRSIYIDWQRSYDE